jgi:hypothetical protein
MTSDDDSYEGPWCAGAIKCAVCGNEHVAVWPACTEDIGCLECPACHQQHSVLMDDEDDDEPWPHYG